MGPQLYCNLTLTLTSQNCCLGWGVPFLSIHCWVMWSASMSHGQTCFPGPLSAGSCVGDWKRGTPVGSNKKGALGCGTLWRYPTKALVPACPLKLQCLLWSRGIPCPRRKAHGGSSASSGQSSVRSLGTWELRTCRLMAQVSGPKGQQGSKELRDKINSLLFPLLYCVGSEVTRAGCSI